MYITERNLEVDGVGLISVGLENISFLFNLKRVTSKSLSPFFNFFFFLIIIDNEIIMALDILRAFHVTADTDDPAKLLLPSRCLFVYFSLFRKSTTTTTTMQYRQMTAIIESSSVTH